MSDEPSKPTVVLSDRQELSVNVADLEALACDTLRSEGIVDAELSVSLVTEDEIAGLHHRYLGEAGATDVLSFPLDEDGDHGEPRLLGDVVICPAVASRQKTDLQAEVRLLLVHGILHLLGYDHEEEEERRAMWERQEAYSGVRAR